MGDINGFKKYERRTIPSLPAEERIKGFEEFQLDVEESHFTEQSARCMDCGIPFCHSGCPLGNLIPDFNHAVYKEDWKKAYELLASTNNFPEFTGRICPAPCESSCVLSINNEAVAIENIEKSIIEKAYNEGWVKPKNSQWSTGKKIAIIGSGPAGLACADQLSEKGHSVTVYEKDDRVGGLLRYGIPDFKLSKTTIDRRVTLMESAGVQFVTHTEVGVDVTTEELKNEYDAIVLCGGATVARDLSIQGRHLKGVHLAMEYLEQNNRKVAGDLIENEILIDVKDQNVVVIGGGDTGSDCIGTSVRLGAQSITQIELMGKPPVKRAEDNPWPNWPQVLRTSSSQEEGCQREWSIFTKRFVSEDGIHLSGLETRKVAWSRDKDGTYQMIEDAEVHIVPCEKAFLAIGFLHGKKEGLLTQLGVELDENGNVKTDHYSTSVENVFAAGDMRRGQSLVVWAIAEGRECAAAVDQFFKTGKEDREFENECAYSL
ncbi:MAG: glutamate synthase subunit beta [Bacteroidota bacterium]